MNDDDHHEPETVDTRSAVARLAEALAAAQGIARELDDESVAATGPSSPQVPHDDVAGPETTLAAAPGSTTTTDELPAVADRADPAADEPDADGSDPDGPASGGPVADEPVSDEPDADGSDPDGPAADEPGTGGPEAAPARGDDASQGRRRLWPLYVVMGLLVVAVPVLGYIGYRLTSDSTSGSVLSGRADPDSPGYLALVEPTPVALVLQTADDGTAGQVTILSLSGPDHKGGAVIAVPLDMRVDAARFGVERFTTTIETNRPETAGRLIGEELGLGFSDVVRMNDTELTRFIEPVAPLTIDNPEEVTTTTGEVFAAGETELAAEQVPAYLAATDAGHTMSGAMARQQLVWTAWIQAIADAGDRAAVPGEKTAGLGRYLDALAGGDVQSAAFPVVPSDEESSDDGTGPALYDVDRDAADLLIANAVPFPVAPKADARATVVLLNGTGPDPAPAAVIQRLTYAGAQITTTGNAGTFDHTGTVVSYSDEAHRAAARRMAEILGVGEVHKTDSADAGADIRIVMGSDLLDDPPRPLTMKDVQ